MGVVIHTKRVSKYLERKHFRELRDRRIIYDNRGIFGKYKERI